MPLMDKYFANPAALPSMPEVAHSLMQSLDKASLGLQELSQLISQDQGLSVKVLRLANSPHYSPSHSVATLQDAAVIIGLEGLRDLALAACAAGAFPQVDGFDRMRFWRQCLATADHARVLAGACDLDPDTAHLAGMVMRTGELLMLMQDPEAMAQAERQASLPDSLLDHERRLLQCSHVQVTAELARRWQFPDTLVLALNAADDPLACRPFCRLGAVLRLASVMAEAGEQGGVALTDALAAQEELLQRLGLELDWVKTHLRPHAVPTGRGEHLLH